MLTRTLEEEENACNGQFGCLAETERYQAERSRPELVRLNRNIPTIQATNEQGSYCNGGNEPMHNIELTLKRSFLNCAKSRVVVAPIGHWHYAISIMMSFVSICVPINQLKKFARKYLTETNNNIIICIYIFYIGRDYLLCFMLIYYLISVCVCK